MWIILLSILLLAPISAYICISPMHISAYLPWCQADWVGMLRATSIRQCHLLGFKNQGFYHNPGTLERGSFWNLDGSQPYVTQEGHLTILPNLRLGYMEPLVGFWGGLLAGLPSCSYFPCSYLFIYLFLIIRISFCCLLYYELPRVHWSQLNWIK